MYICVDMPSGGNKCTLVILLKAVIHGCALSTVHIKLKEYVIMFLQCVTDNTLSIHYDILIRIYLTLKLSGTTMRVAYILCARSIWISVE